MHQPRPRIIRLKRNNQIPRRRQHRRIASWRIDQRQIHTVRISTRPLRKDEEVVSVEVNRMRHAQRRLNHNIHPFIRIRQLNDRIRGGKCRVTVEELEEGG